MPTVYDCADTERLLEAVRVARQALARGELVIVPTDTVYGVAANAFDADAVRRMQRAAGRGRQSPPTVFVPDTATLNSLAARIPGPVHQLTPRLWPGPLTLVLTAQPSLQWDLGDADGTVALRMPDHSLVLEILRETGPLAVTSATLPGTPAPRTAAAAVELLGDAVAVCLDAGELAAAPESAEGDGRSTILDATGAAGRNAFRVLRRGAVTVEQLRIVLGEDAVIDLDAPTPTEHEPAVGHEPADGDPAPAG